MANNISFTPLGKTTLLTATTSTSTVGVTADSPANQFMFVNTGTNDVFVHMSLASNVTVTRPTAGTSQYGFCVGANSYKIVSNGQSSSNVTIYVAGVSNAGTALVYITPGEGL
jgi:cold shock CspA family protein